LPYGEFPWFRKAIIDEIYAVELLHKKHLYWPNPDVDIHLDSIENPEEYPLIANQ
jgi:hypothetical protein